MFPDLVVSVSATTRPKRRGEVDGREYLFLSEDRFKQWVEEDRFLEWATYGGHLYGTPRSAVERHLGAGRDVILEIELEGAWQVQARYPGALMVFIMPPSLEELGRRLRGRNTENETVIAMRLAKAREEMAAIEAEMSPTGRRRFDYVIVNDSVGRASEELAQIIERTRIEDEQADNRRDS